MLLPSALGCDSSHTLAPPKRQLFASPLLSPPASSSSSIGGLNIYSTCRALQSMLSPTPPPAQLPSPPTTHTDIPANFKLRLRARGPKADELTPRKKITKRATQVPRGLNKRRRAVEDDMSRGTVDIDSENEEDAEMGPSTPKRARLAPEVLPLGLERADFHDLRLQELSQGQSTDLVASIESDPSSSTSLEKNEEWTTEDDRILVELVLEKLKLSKSEWQDCARSLGKDRGSVGKRWKSLIVNGEVGLKRRGRIGSRPRIHGTWR